MKWITVTEDEFKKLNAEIERQLGIPSKDGKTLRYAVPHYNARGACAIPVKPWAEKHVPDEYMKRARETDEMQKLGWFPPKKQPGDRVPDATVKPDTAAVDAAASDAEAEAVPVDADAVKPTLRLASVLDAEAPSALEAPAPTTPWKTWAAIAAVGAAAAAGVARLAGWLG